MYTQATLDAAAKAAAKRDEWMKFYSEFEAVGDQQAKSMTGEDVTKFKAYEKEVGELQAAYDTLKGIDEAKDANRKAMAEGRKLTDPPSGHTPPSGGRKSAGEIVLSKGLAAFRTQRSEDFVFDDIDPKSYLGLERKTTMTTAANGYPPEVVRDGDVVGAVFRPPQLIDFLRWVPTTQNGLKWMAQTVRTSAADEDAEGDAMGEAVLTWAEQTDSIRRIGHYIPVTEEELEDEAGLQGMINMELSNMVRERLDSECMVGDGIAPNITGIFSASGIQTQAKGADPAFDALGKAIKLVSVTGRANPNLVCMHSTDLWNLALTRTADGIYILGNPANAPVRAVWGLPIAANEALTVGSSVVLDTNYFIGYLRKGITVAYSDSHGDNFVKNLQVIKAYCRAGLKKRRGAAACKVTGL
jgi:HK97 family phage major capsid protein